MLRQLIVRNEHTRIAGLVQNSPKQLNNVTMDGVDSETSSVVTCVSVRIWYSRGHHIIISEGFLSIFVITAWVRSYVFHSNKDETCTARLLSCLIYIESMREETIQLDFI